MKKFFHWVKNMDLKLIRKGKKMQTIKMVCFSLMMLVLATNYTAADTLGLAIMVDTSSIKGQYGEIDLELKTSPDTIYNGPVYASVWLNEYNNTNILGLTTNGNVVYSTSPFNLNFTAIAKEESNMAVMPVLFNDLFSINLLMDRDSIMFAANFSVFVKDDNNNLLFSSPSPNGSAIEFDMRTPLYGIERDPMVWQGTQSYFSTPEPNSFLLFFESLLVIFTFSVFRKNYM
jgi:hypothetical protein